MVGVQLPLFDLSQELPLTRSERIAAVSWSHSKRSAKERCLLSYYFTYYGSKKRIALSEPHKERLRFLNDRVQTRHLFAGSILHSVIKTFFKKAQEGDVYSPDRLVDFARFLFDQGLNYSRRYHADDSFLDPRYPPTILKEYLIQQEDADELCLEAEERLLSAVHVFASDPQYAYFRTKGSSPESLVEERLSLDTLPCKVTGMIDLAFEDNGSVTLVDWKLGKTDGLGDDSLQLAVYGLWAVDHFRCHPDRLKVCKVHLSSNDIVYFHAGKEVLHEALLRVLQDAERMAYWDERGRNGVSEAFTPCDQFRVCRSCIYEEVCYGS